jgi:hypothetical protein
LSTAVCYKALTPSVCVMQNSKRSAIRSSILAGSGLRLTCGSKPP